MLADLTGCPIERPQVVETTALGAAYLAGLGAGVYASTEELGAQWRIDRRFDPIMGADERDARYAGWKDAISRILTRATG
jgi:glycerol kinase